MPCPKYSLNCTIFETIDGYYSYKSEDGELDSKLDFTFWPICCWLCSKLCSKYYTMKAEFITIAENHPTKKKLATSTMMVN